jgi:hypothetical protein
MPAESPRLVRAVDLTGDGRLDYVVDSGGYVCTNALSVTSAGHDGAAVSIFVGRPAGTAALAYEGFSHGVNVTRLRGSPRIHLIVGARACGQPAGPRPFSDWWFCSRRLVWNTRNRRFVFAPISEARRIDRRVR